MPYCPECGADVTADVDYCPSCGALLASDPASESRETPAGTDDGTGQQPSRQGQQSPQQAPPDSSRGDDQRRAGQPRQTGYGPQPSQHPPEQRQPPQEGAGTGGEPPDGDRGGGSGFSRRAALGALGLGAAGAAAGAWYLFARGSGTDGPGPGPSGAGRAWQWLPRPGRVTGADVLPFHVLQPAGSVVDYQQYHDTLTAMVRSLPPGGEQFSLPLASIDSVVAASRLRVATGEFDAGAVTDTLESAGFQSSGTHGGLTVLARPDGTMAVGVSGRTVVVGRHTPDREATAVVRTAIDAGRGQTARYVDGDAAAFREAVSDPEFAFWRPVPGVDDPDPASGRFAAERGYGSVATFEDDRVAVEYVRAFADASALDANREQLRANVPQVGAGTLSEGVSTTIDGNTFRVAFAVPADEAGAFYGLASPAFRSVPVPDVDLEVRAQRFSYSFVRGGQEYIELPEPLEAGREYTVALISRDVVHGLAVEPLGIERVVTPGERRVFTLTPGDADLTLRASRYVGAGTNAMVQEVPVASGDAGGASEQVADYLGDVSNFDGVVDRTGRKEVEVRVGVEINGGAFGFGPPAVRIDPGATVVWEWTGQGGSHNVVHERGAFDSGGPVAEAGHTFTYTFDREGIYRYYCAPHKSLGMKGAVLVGT